MDRTAKQRWAPSSNCRWHQPWLALRLCRPTRRPAPAAGLLYAGREFSLQVLVPSGKTQPFALEWHGSPDVQQYMKQRGIAGAADRARFTVRCANRDGMLLSVRSGGDELARIVLDDKRTSSPWCLSAH